MGGQFRMSFDTRISTGRPTALAATEYLLLSKRTRHVLDAEA
jgi:hypothetical protein